MSEMNKDFEKSFEAQWQEAFDGAELSPRSDLWDSIESQLAPSSPAVEGGRQGLLWFYIVFVWFLGIFFIQKTSRVVAEKNNVASQVGKAQATILPTNTAIQISSVPETVVEVLPTQQASQNLPAIVTQQASQNLPTIEAQQASRNLPTTVVRRNSNLPAIDAQNKANLPTQPNVPNPPQGIAKAEKEGGKQGGWFGKKAGEQVIKHMKTLIHKAIGTRSKENAVEALTPIAMRTLPVPVLFNREINYVAYAAPSKDKRYTPKPFWIGVQRGLAIASPKLDIRYEAYLADYVEAHQLQDNTDLTNFFTETDDRYRYSLANQADIRFGYQFTPRWQFSAGLQYRIEFLEQTTNAFFVNYYDYSRHSFLIDILEGNIENPNFAQAVVHHPTYRANGDNTFTMSQFNQQSLIHLSSQFQYIGIPMQVGYTLRPFKKLGFVLLGSAQVDKLVRSATSSYELKDDVATTYKLNTAVKLSTWSWQIGGGIQAEYKYNEHWGLTVTGIASQNIKPIKENKYVVVRPRGLQVNVGAKYMF